MSSPAAALVRKCLERLGCPTAELASRHLYISNATLLRILAGQPPAPALERLITDLARRLGCA